MEQRVFGCPLANFYRTHTFVECLLTLTIFRGEENYHDKSFITVHLSQHLFEPMLDSSFAALVHGKKGFGDCKSPLQNQSVTNRVLSLEHFYKQQHRSIVMLEEFLQSMSEDRHFSKFILPSEKLATSQHSIRLQNEHTYG